MLKIKGFFTWDEGQVLFSSSAYINNGFLYFNEGKSKNMLVCKSKNAKSARKMANSLNKKLIKYHKINLQRKH